MMHLSTSIAYKALEHIAKENIVQRKRVMKNRTKGTLGLCKVTDLSGIVFDNNQLFIGKENAVNLL